jgi:hypothetical protein
MSEQDSLFKEPGMNDQPNTTPEGAPTPFSARGSNDSDLAQQLRTTQRQLSNLMLVLLVVSGTLAIFLLQQVRYARADVGSLQAQAQQIEQARQMIADYNANNVPAMKNFIQQLGEYATTHPDVLPVLAKYGLATRRPNPAPAQTP